MNSIDIIITLIASYFIIRGIIRGFISEVAIVLGFICGYILTITYFGLAAEILLTYLPKIPLLLINIIAFVSIFILVNLIIRIVAGLVTKSLSLIMLGWLNRLLGGIFGLIKIIIIMSFLVFLFELFPFSEKILQDIGAKESILFSILEFLGPEFFKEIQNIFN